MRMNYSIRVTFEGNRKLIKNYEEKIKQVIERVQEAYNLKIL
jgi:hypothetical protein